MTRSIQHPMAFLLTCAVVTAGLGTSCVRRSPLPDSSASTIEYRSAPSEEGAREPVLERTRSILEDRLRAALGEGNCVTLSGERILVHLIDSSDTERAQGLIETAGSSSWHIVAPPEFQTPEWFAVLDPGSSEPVPIGAAGLRLLAGPPENTSGRVVVHDGPDSVLKGDHILEAGPTLDDLGLPAISIRFDGPGAEQMARLTQANVARKMALQVDGSVLTVASINSRVHEAMILQGGYTDEKARDLAALLGHGELPVDLQRVR